MNHKMSTRNAVETAIDLSKMEGTWEYLLSIVNKVKGSGCPRKKYRYTHGM